MTPTPEQVTTPLPREGKVLSFSAAELRTRTKREGREYYTKTNPTKTVKAIQINEPFEVRFEDGNVIPKKAGDYFVCNDLDFGSHADSRHVFEHFYSEVKKK